MNVAVLTENCLKLYTPTSLEIYNETNIQHLPSDDVLLVSKVLIFSKENFINWFLHDQETSASSVKAGKFDGVIVICQNGTLTICDENGKKEFQISDIDRISLPDEIGFSETAEIMLADDMKNPFIVANYPKREYLHATGEGVVLIEDIKINGHILRLNGKSHFIPVESIGYDKLEKSEYFKVLKMRKKVEIVNQEYYIRNRDIKAKAPAVVPTLKVGSVRDFEGVIDKNDVSNQNIIEL